MDTQSPTTTDTRTVSLPGAELTYDVRGDLAAATADRPTLVLIGTPMTAEGFTTLAEAFGDRPVVTYDPRNTGRSRCTAGRTPTPEEHAADVRAILAALQPELGSPQVDLFGSSGGAINALALVAAHPEDLRVVLAHEPPSSAVLPDADVLLGACRDVFATYQAFGFGDAFAPCRLVLAVGEDSGETMAARAPRAIAAALGTEAVVFPGDHGGFLGGELGQTGRPAGFAATLREVLDGPVTSAA